MTFWSRLWRRGVARGNDTLAGDGSSSLESGPDGHGEHLRTRLNDLPPPLLCRDQDVLVQPLLVFDLETSGLNVQRDTVLSLGAVRIENNAIPMGRQLQRVLKVDASLRQESQLIHGLTQADLQAGSHPGDALLDLLEFGADAIWLAFHAEFDRLMLQRALARHLDTVLRHAPLDVAGLAPMLFPDYVAPHAGLDHWIKVFGLTVPARHHAVADAQVTAELVLILLQQAHQQGLNTWGELEQALLLWQKKQQEAGSFMF